MEACHHAIRPVPGPRLGGHGQLIRLAGVAQIQRVRHLDRRGCRALARQLGDGLGLHGREQRGQLVRTRLRRGREHGPHQRHFERARQQAGGGEEAGSGRHDRTGHAQDGGKRAGVQWSTPSKSHHGEAARVVSALDRDDAQGTGHVGVDEADDAGGQVHGAQVQPLGKRGHSAHGRVAIHRHGAAEQVRRVEPSEQQVGVRHRGIGAAACVADRAGIGPRAHGADAQRAAGIHVGDGPPSGRYLCQIQERKAHGVAAAAHVPPAVRAAGRLIFGHGLGRTMQDRAGLGRRTAHVQAQHALQLQAPGQLRRRRQTAGRP